MCSITVNKSVDDKLVNQRKNDKRNIENRLIQFAQHASIETRGRLDEIGPMKRMPPELRHIRKLRIGRHRIFFTGRHTMCTYRVFFIKFNKKKGVNDEDDPRFQKALIRGMQSTQHRKLEPPD